MIVKFNKVKPGATLPSYQTDQSAGMDVSAFLEEPIIIKPLQRSIVPTGLAVEVPEGFEVQVRARSGLSAKYGISLVNGIGTIDADYRGEIGVILVNLGEKDFVINNGDRVAQLVVAKYEKVEIIESNILSETQRGSGGFGSTGI
jgi:dUTP pyrophosphatase